MSQQESPPGEDERTLWDTHLKAMAHPARYQLRDTGLSPDQLHATPFAAAAQHAAGSMDFEKYADASADVVMRGGTASGVVYPAALCAIAEKFRLRNVGGSSAGAIAAAAAAAAELGRVRAQVSTPDSVPPDAPAAPGTVRQGFAGLADLTMWLTEMTATGPAAEGEPERYRLASLFQPAAAARPIFRVAAAVLRQRYWQLLLLLPMASLAMVTVASILAVGAGTLVAAWGADPDRPAWPFPPHWPVAGQAVVAVVGVLVLTVSVILLTASVITHLSRRKQARRNAGEQPGSYIVVVARHVLRLGRTATSRLFWTGATLLLAGGLLVTILALWAGSPRTVALLLLGGLGTNAAAIIVNAVSYAVDFKVRVVDKAAGARYGLISGATRPRGQSILDEVAGIPGKGADRALVPWLEALFEQLAGQPGEVLRFGHLWFDSFVVETAPQYHLHNRDAAGLGGEAAARLVRNEAASYDSKKRLVNLELMSSDISNGVAYRFPLNHVARNHEPGLVGLQERLLPHASLYVCPADFLRQGAEVFGPEVVDALCDTSPAQTATIVGVESAAEITVHRLPDPWNLPVVFAVRLSLALPFLFQSVPLYRRIDDDTLGLRLERVWFSDGGLTSNFPIHFFDQAVPPWPTLGINLTGIPASGDAHPFLPELHESPSEPRRIGNSLLAFFGAIFATSRNWRDNMHILLPGFGIRVVAVRLRRSEGDTNIFMKRDAMASLALRGVQAGITLREGFARGTATGSRWQQHQVMRLQTAVMSLAKSLTTLRDGTPRIGLIKAIAEPDGPAVLAAQDALLDGVFAPDVLSLWQSYRDAVENLVAGPFEDSDPASLGGLLGRAGLIAAGGRALSALPGPPGEVAAQASWLASAATALQPPAQAHGAVTLATAADVMAAAAAALAAGPGAVGEDRNAMSTTVLRAARDLDAATAALARQSIRDSVHRLSAAWDRHGTSESRQVPRS